MEQPYNEVYQFLTALLYQFTTARDTELERERTIEVNCACLSSLSTGSVFRLTIGMPAHADRLATERTTFLG
ncbi:hypothetical protein LMG9964_06546 [Paraburkholderia phenoliruptrix]|uniref:Uncharacterized protein n=2 Tax=Paraburkholderia phenoliruptrix TaxID=252970 RepID=K0DZZ4_9BURK|nr:hypothetical protein BUPH_08307 [Paraburkholderia phenoliruptrix BR3459a]CAB4052855.1 hypothetical protein LMG9964_06546 [Paraburkholderia phenoliruptrix]